MQTVGGPDLPSGVDDILGEPMIAHMADLLLFRTETHWSSILSILVRLSQEARKHPKNICSGHTMHSWNE